MTYSLFSDGGSRGNPGPAGAGFVIFDHTGKEVYTGSEFLGIATNNVAEYTALIQGLQKALEENISTLECFLDSELIVKQLTGVYRVKHPDMKILFQQVQNLKPQFQSIHFAHVFRDKNTRADALANMAMDRKH